MADATPILMLSLLDDAGDGATELDMTFASVAWQADAFTLAYGPFVESSTSLPLLIAPNDAPLRIAVDSSSLQSPRVHAPLEDRQRRLLPDDLFCRPRAEHGEADAPARSRRP